MASLAFSVLFLLALAFPSLFNSDNELYFLLLVVLPVALLIGTDPHRRGQNSK